MRPTLHFFDGFKQHMYTFEGEQYPGFVDMWNFIMKAPQYLPMFHGICRLEAAASKRKPFMAQREIELRPVEAEAHETKEAEALSGQRTPRRQSLAEELTRDAHGDEMLSWTSGSNGAWSEGTEEDEEAEESEGTSGKEEVSDDDSQESISVSWASCVTPTYEPDYDWGAMTPDQKITRPRQGRLGEMDKGADASGSSASSSS